MSSIFRISNLETEKIDHQLWRLTRPLMFGTMGGLLTVPKGFITDGASCPKILWSLCSPMTGPQAEAAVLHDYLYSKDSHIIVDRKQADQLFYEAMIANGTSIVKAQLIYRGVRLGGSGSWKKRHSLDKIKEK
jgi:hypothetical protein